LNVAVAGKGAVSTPGAAEVTEPRIAYQSSKGAQTLSDNSRPA